MPIATLAFQFSQRFPFPAWAVYRWATNYQPQDIGLLGKNGRRGVQHLNDDTVLLSDVFVQPNGSRVTKKKIIRLYPTRHSWTNTHVSGPNKYSQFLYVLVPMGRYACRLEFTGRQIVPVKKVNAAEVKRLTAQVLKDDIAMWKKLAATLAADLKGGA